METLDLQECRDRLHVIVKDIVRLFAERMPICGDVAS